MSLAENKNYLFDKNIFIIIFSFLFREDVAISKNVCKSWLVKLKSELAKKKLELVPKNLSYSSSQDIKLVPIVMFKNKNYIYTNTGPYTCIINTENFKII